MRMLLIATIAVLALASTAQANQRGAEPAKSLNNKQMTKSYLGRQHRRHKPRKYVYNDFPDWAARAFQPSQNR